jgi:hypothetical protein
MNKTPDKSEYCHPANQTMEVNFHLSQLKIKKENDHEK